MSKRNWLAVLVLLMVGGTATWSHAQAAASPAPGTRGRYAVLTAEWDAPAPFAAVEFLYGPAETVGDRPGTWWQLDIYRQGDRGGEPSVSLRGLTDGDPLRGAGTVAFERYLLRVPGTGEALEYRDIHTGKALLPAWRDFTKHFVPAAGRGTLRQAGLPETALLLGHTLTLQNVWQGVEWKKWDSKRLDLDPQLLVGTGRNFRDAEGKRLPQTPQRQNYTYVRFTRDEYSTMIDAGVNLFTVEPEQSTWIQDRPVFYLRGSGGKPALQFPGDLYRSNYIGSVMFMDEPAIIMVGDKLVHTTLRYFSDAANLLEQRVRSRYFAGNHYSAFSLENELKKSGINFGAMRLEHCDYPAWETLYTTAYYQLDAGLAGIVHEGRYRLAEFDKSLAQWSPKPRKHTAEEMLRYHYAFLRGAARATGKDWGMSIYGQAEQAYSPLAVKLAYDMGARYVWFWTSDHEHHVPWVEQMELCRQLKAHAAEHPRGSIRRALPTLDTAIVIPYGYMLELGGLWWVRALDKEGKSEHSQRFARVMRGAHAAVQEAMEKHEDYDIVVDGGQPITGYRKVVRISDELDGKR